MNLEKIIDLLSRCDTTDPEELDVLLDEISHILLNTERKILNHIAKIKRYIRSNELGLARFELDRICEKLKNNLE